MGQKQHRDALAELCDRITSPLIMGYPDYNYPFVLHTDASLDGLGAVLYQKRNGKMRIMGYGSRSLSPAEKKYHSGKLEFLALKWPVCKHFRDYLYYAPHFMVYTDNNPLTYTLTTARLNATGHRWVAELSEFKFDIIYRPSKFDRTIFKELHQDMGHLGAKRVVELARERFYWARMEKDIVRGCLKQSKPNLPACAPLCNITTSAPFQLI